MDTAQEISDRVDRILEGPKFPFWLLCKLIWFELRGKQVESVILGPAYEVHFAGHGHN